MATDDLDTPLGQATRKTRARFPAAMPYVVAGVLALFSVAVVLWATFANDPLGGEPVAVVLTNPPVVKASADQAGAGKGEHDRYDGPSGKSATPAVAVKEEPQAPAGSKIITIINGASGTKQNIVVPDNAADKKTGSSEVTPAQPKATLPLTEKSPEGAIPTIGPQGERAMTIYAHPRKLPAAKTDAPRIAIIIGGMGISASGTAAALAKLPAFVTFAIAPYGSDLEALAARARQGNHELLLQAPMEPFDYPDNDPGPQTLLTSLTPAQNADRLHWLMSRFQGYVGIAGYMGARFTASEQAFAPVLKEIAKRGLIYVDDGVSPRSIAARIAAGQNFPFAKTDVVLDAVQTPLEVDHALARLELLAREHGSAVGMATALPSTVDRIANWAAQVEKRGIVLVPISMIALKAKSS
ncbi:MAG TPA: divergent polysaccharide deacetylase family protein [Pseudolabrys sp.]|nr:divergent polysaccharide deacetylase family protein [Pseudolabrys sp.]